MKFLYSQKKTPHFLIPVLKSKNIVKLYREGSNRPHPHLLLKKKVKTLQKESRKKWYHIYTKKSIFWTRKITVRCSIKKMKKKENHLWCFTKLKFKKKNTKKQNKTSRKILTANVSTIFFLSQAKKKLNRKRKKKELSMIEPDVETCLNKKNPVKNGMITQCQILMTASTCS